MKQQATQYLALDVHQATSVATVRDGSGAIRMRATVPTEAKAIIGLVKPVHVAFEKARKRNGCTTCCSRTLSAWWSATSAGEARRRTRAIGSMLTGCPSSFD
jgi:hypothetical protein